MTEDASTNLDQLEQDVLRRLERLSEGGTTDYDRPNLHRVHPGSTAPPGVNLERQPGQAPDPLASLYAYHVHQLNEARDKSLTWRLRALAAATHDLETAQHRPPQFVSGDADQNKRDRDDAILMMEGERPEKVAVFLGCSESNVRKVRKLAGRNSTSGEPLSDDDGQNKAA